MSGLVVAGTVAACSGGDDGGPEPTPTIDIALSAVTLSVVQGANQTVNLTLTRGGGFTEAVTIDVEGEPAGITATAAPASIPGNQTTSVITIAATGTAAPGNYPLTVRATGTGVTAKTAALALTVTAAPAQSYTLAVTPATVSIPQSGTNTANVAITRTGNFAGAVTLAAEGLPAGVTGVFAPQGTTGGTSTLTLTATAAAAVGGPTTITVRGTAAGQTDKTATFALTVTAASGFTLAVAPTSVTVQQGGNQTATVTVTRTGGFAGAVALTATGLPNGVTAAFNPASVTAAPNTSTLTLTASPTATVGQATVTIRGNSAPLAEQTATLTVNVTAATGGSGNTTWEFCTAGDTPIWLAVQDGTGAWTRVTPTGTRFQFNIASARGGVAFVTSTTDPMIASQRTLAKRMSAAIETTLLIRNKAAQVRAGRYAARSRSLVDGFELSIFYGTQAELNTQGTSQCLTGSGKTVNGTVANVSAAQTASISLGDAFASVSGGATNFQLTDVADGSLDLLASRSTFNLTTFQTTVDKLILRRGVNAANNSTLPVLDFNAAEAFAPAEANLTVANLGTDVPIVSTTYTTASGTSGASLFSGIQTGAGPYKYYGVPTAQQIAGDLHLAFVIAAPSSTTADNARFSALFFKDPTDRTVTLGAVLGAQTVSAVATTPYVRFRATGPMPAEYNKYIQVIFTQASTTVARGVSIGASAAYLSNATTYDFTVPDFTGVAGWDNNWGPKAGVETEWSVSGTGFTGIGVDTPNPVEGSTIQGAVRFGTITP